MWVQDESSKSDNGGGCESSSITASTQVKHLHAMLCASQENLSDIRCFFTDLFLITLGSWNSKLAGYSGQLILKT